MALQDMELGPAEGVTQTEFDAHTHSYRRVDQVGVDDSQAYGSPSRVTIVDDTEVNVGQPKNVKAVGVTVSTQQTNVPT